MLWINRGQGVTPARATILVNVVRRFIFGSRSRGTTASTPTSASAWTHPSAISPVRVRVDTPVRDFTRVRVDTPVRDFTDTGIISTVTDSSHPSAWTHPSAISPTPGLFPLSRIRHGWAA